VRRVVQSRQAVRHAVDDAEADVREAHARDVLAQGHALAPVLRVLHGAAQMRGDEADGLEMEHVAHLPGTLGDEALDGVGQSVHAGRGGEAPRHGGHHLRVDDRDLGDVVRVDADEFALLLHVGDDVVDRDLGRGSGGGGHGNGEGGVVLRVGDALEAHHVGELGVLDDDADRLRGVHGRAAADGDDAVGPGGLERAHTGLDVFNGGVGLDVGVELVGDLRPVQHVQHLLGDAELHEIGVGADKGFFTAAGSQLMRDLGDRAGAVVRDGVENNAIGHSNLSFAYMTTGCGILPVPLYHVFPERKREKWNFLLPVRRIREFSRRVRWPRRPRGGPAG